MNVLLWILQLALALFYFAGGAYKLFMFNDLSNQLSAMPRAGWVGLGLVEMMCAVLLVLPISARWVRLQTPLAGGALALETLALAGFYASYSVEWTAANPMTWAVVMGLLAAFVAYGRYALRPQA